MDFLCGHERKFSCFEDPDMNDVLGQDMFTTSSSMGVEDSYMTLPTMTDNDHNDWFNSIFDEHGLVYNDKNLGEAATQQPSIKSEHSYSVNNLNPSSPLSLAKTDETDYQTSNTALDLSPKNQLIHTTATVTQPHCIKYEPLDTDPLLMSITSTATGTTLARPSNILLTTTSSSTTAASRNHSGRAVFPITTTPTTTATIHIKTEPMDDYETLQEQTVSLDNVILPPSPPSSNGSDSDGSQSPQHSTPNSPQRQSPVRVYHYHHFTQVSSPDSRTSCSAQTLSQPLFLSPVPQSGVLILTEEEKRTLISEGYPIPSKLPLTKQEEKNLKKVRRKIKNKISAQESRRKKKEYVEALEKRVEVVNHENCDLKKKLESLESNNRSLLGQLHKLQALVAKVPQTTSASATQTGTVLMVLVLCFAMFLGGTGNGVRPTTFSLGYSGVRQPALAFLPSAAFHTGADMNFVGTHNEPAHHTADDYTTPNLKSRVLMAFAKEEWDVDCDNEEDKPLTACIRDHTFPMNKPLGFSSSLQACDPLDDQPMPDVAALSVAVDPEAKSLGSINAVESETNMTGGVDDDDDDNDDQALMHPDIAVTPIVGNLAEGPHADLDTA